MHDPFELMWWALGIGLAWMMLGIFGLTGWVKNLGGGNKPDKELAARMDALEERIKQLEKKP
jgi:hypothetical protein